MKVIWQKVLEDTRLLFVFLLTLTHRFGSPWYDQPSQVKSSQFYLCIISAWLPTDDVNVGSDLSGTFMAEMCKHHRSRHMTLRDTWAWIHITAAADFCEEVQDPVAYKILTRRRVIARATRTCNLLPCLTIHNPAVWSQRIIIKNNIYVKKCDTCDNK